MSSAASGPSDPYDAHDEGIVEAALDAAFQDWDDGPGASGAEPTRMQARAQVEWNGVVDRANRGVREPNLGPARLSALRPDLEAARKANARVERAEGAGPARSYTAKGWHAQLRALTSSSRGSSLADRAGLNPSARTLQKWLSDAEYPIRRSDREKISEAYSGLRTSRMDTARESAEAANHRLAEKLNEVLGGAHHGAEIRLRNIEWIRFR